MEKNAEIRADWRNVANDLGNIWEVSWCWLLYGCMVSLGALQEIFTSTYEN